MFTKKGFIAMFAVWLGLMGAIYGVPWLNERIQVAQTVEQWQLPDYAFESYKADGWTIAWSRTHYWIVDNTNQVKGLKDVVYMEVKKPINWRRTDMPTVFMTPAGEVFFNPQTKTVIFDKQFGPAILDAETNDAQVGFTFEIENMGFLFKRNGEVILMNYNLAPKE